MFNSAVLMMCTRDKKKHGIGRYISTHEKEGEIEKDWERIW